MSNGTSEFYLSVDRTLVLVNAILSLGGFLTCINFPRRPEVFHHGRAVDGGLSVSAFMRYTWSWPGDLLALSKSGKELEYDDMQTLDHYTRAQDLFTSFTARQQGQPSILKILPMCHLRSLISQNLLTALDALFMVAPQFAMYHLLRLLEARDAGANISLPAMFWVLALGISIMVGGFLNNWMWLVDPRPFMITELIAHHTSETVISFRAKSSSNLRSIPSRRIQLIQALLARLLMLAPCDALRALTFSPIFISTLFPNICLGGSVTDLFTSQSVFNWPVLFSPNPCEEKTSKALLVAKMLR
jgi:hypothetical protein